MLLELHHPLKMTAPWASDVSVILVGCLYQTCGECVRNYIQICRFPVRIRAGA